MLNKLYGAAKERADAIRTLHSRICIQVVVCWFPDDQESNQKVERQQGEEECIKASYVVIHRSCRQIKPRSRYINCS